MVHPIQEVKTVTVLSQRTKAVEQYLFEDSSLGISEEHRGKIASREVSKIEVSDGLGNSSYKISVDRDQGNVLRLSQNQYQAVLNIIYGKRNGEDTNVTPTQRGIDYEERSTGKFLGLTTIEQRAYDSMQHVVDILRRAFGRRTSMSSWILYGIIRSFGFKGGDNFGPVESILNNPDFTRKFAIYYSKIKSGDKLGAKRYLESAFKDENQDLQKQKLTRLVSWMMKVCNWIPRKVISIVPIAFCIQNITVPLLARWVIKEGPIKRIFSFMRMINPWLDEFVASLMGIFKHEINGVKDTTASLDTLPRRSKNDIDVCAPQQVNNVESIELTDLDADQYKLKKMVEKINDALERLLGRKSNLSSLIATCALWLLGFKDYQDFAARTVKKASFIQDFHSYLKNMKKVKTSSESQKTDVSENKFKTKEEGMLAYALTKMVTIAKSMSAGFIKEAPKYFGGVYSIQYLFMPILTALWGEKGWFGKLLGIVRDINPILNDAFFDLIATFREEVVGVKDLLDSNKSVSDLFPDLPTATLAKNIRSLFKTVHGFGRDVGKKVSGREEPGYV